MNENLRTPRELWVLAIGSMIIVTGTSFLWPLTTIYISEVLGKSVSVAGLVLMLNSGTGILGSFFGGYLHDKIGGKRTVMAAVFMSCCCVFALAATRDWAWYVTLMGLIGFSNSMVFPVLYAMAGGMWPEGGRKAFNLLYVSQNLGVATGAALGGVVAHVSFTYVFVANGIMYLLFLCLFWVGLRKVQQTGRAKERTQSDAGEQPARSVRKSGHFHSLLLLCLGFAACWVGYSQWYTNIATYMYSLSYPLTMYSLLWTVNGALILLGQPFILFLTNRILLTSRSQLIAGSLIFFLALLIVSMTDAYFGFLTGMVVMTIGEMLVWPAVPTAAAELAPAGRLGTYQGIVNGFATTGRMIGPFLGGVLYDSFQPQAMIVGMNVFCLAAFFCFFLSKRLGHSSRMDA